MCPFSASSRANSTPGLLYFSSTSFAEQKTHIFIHVSYTRGTQKAYIDKLAYIYLKDKKILETRSFGKDIWYIPGGKRDEGESDIAALTREVKEELDVDLVLETIKHYGTFEAQAHGKPEGTVVRMTCYEADFVGEFNPTNEVEEMAYFSYADKHRTSPVDQLIFDDLKAKDLIPLVLLRNFMRLGAVFLRQSIPPRASWLMFVFQQCQLRAHERFLDHKAHRYPPPALG